MRPAASASSAMRFGCAVLTPIRQPPTRTSSQRQSSFAVGLVLGDSQTSDPGSVSPIIAPGLATCAVTVSPPSSVMSLRNRL